MKNLIVISAITGICFSASAQQPRYSTAFGVKGDWSTIDIDLAEFSVKHFVKGTPNALELNLGAGRRYGWFHLLYQRNNKFIGDTEWFYGGGFDLGIENTNYSNPNGERRNSYWAGLDGTVGVEYTFQRIPINLSLDMGPTFRVYPQVKVAMLVGFACRWAFYSKKQPRTFRNSNI